MKIVDAAVNTARVHFISATVMEPEAAYVMTFSLDAARIRLSRSPNGEVQPWTGGEDCHRRISALVAKTYIRTVRARVECRGRGTAFRGVSGAPPPGANPNCG